MRIDDNGVVREMTADEESAYNAMQSEFPVAELTAEERVSLLEDAFNELMGVVLGD